VGIATKIFYCESFYLGFCLEQRGSQLFSDHEPLQHFDRLTCTLKFLVTETLSKLTKIY